MAEASLRVGDTLVIVTCTSDTKDFYRQAFDEIAEVSSRYADDDRRRDAVINAVVDVVSAKPAKVAPPAWRKGA